MNLKKSESELFFDFIVSKELRSELSNAVKSIKRDETQKELAEIIGTPLTKIKQIENGTCKDFNAIYNYLSYYGYSLELYKH